MKPMKCMIVYSLTMKINRILLVQINLLRVLTGSPKRILLLNQWQYKFHHEFQHFRDCRKQQSTTLRSQGQSVIAKPVYLRIIKQSSKLQVNIKDVIIEPNRKIWGQWNQSTKCSGFKIWLLRKATLLNRNQNLKYLVRILQAKCSKSSSRLTSDAS